MSYSYRAEDDDSPRGEITEIACSPLHVPRLDLNFALGHFSFGMHSAFLRIWVLCKDLSLQFFVVERENFI